MFLEAQAIADLGRFGKRRPERHERRFDDSGRRRICGDGARRIQRFPASLDETPHRREGGFLPGGMQIDHRSVALRERSQAVAAIAVFESDQPHEALLRDLTAEVKQANGAERAGRPPAAEVRAGRGPFPAAF